MHFVALMLLVIICFNISHVSLSMITALFHTTFMVLFMSPKSIFIFMYTQLWGWTWIHEGPVFMFILSMVITLEIDAIIMIFSVFCDGTMTSSFYVIQQISQQNIKEWNVEQISASLIHVQPLWFKLFTFSFCIGLLGVSLHVLYCFLS